MGSLIIQVALINAVMPPIELMFVLLKTRIMRCIDQCQCICRPGGNSKTQKRTRKKTLWTFKELYNGDEFEIHYQYSGIIVICWVTFMFGPGLPILFPIGLFGLIVLYCTSRIQLAYFSKRPPAYGLEMSQIVIKMLRIPPLLYVFTGIWLYSNQQVFEDRVLPMTDSTLMMDSGHHF